MTISSTIKLIVSASDSVTETYLLENNPTGIPRVDISRLGTQIYFQGMNFEIMIQGSNQDIYNFIRPFQMKRLYVWKNVWFYNKKGMFVGIGETESEALANVVKYLVGINFGNMSENTIEAMVREMASNTQPEVVNTEIGLVLWQPE